MINFLNAHFGALSALFILSLMIITEWKDKHAGKNGGTWTPITEILGQ